MENRTHLENRADNKVTTPLTKGLIISLIVIVIDIIASFAGFRFETWYTWVPTLIFCAAIIWACINYANQMNNAVTFGNVFAHGFKTTAVVTCILIVYTLLSLYLLFPDTKEVALEKARQQMEKNPEVSEEMIDQAMEMTNRLFVPFAIGGALIGNLISGALASVLGAAFARKNPPAPFQQS
jgi:hypothetical protein